MHKADLLPHAEQLPALDNLAEVLLSGRPLLDVRAPIEVAEGSFPQAINLPLMTDEERSEIGKRYKQQGQDAAIALGVQRVSGTVKTQRVQAWTDFFRAYPDAVLYCFRGGLRSRVTQQWLLEHTGQAYPRLAGGYKAMRQWALSELAQLESWLTPVVISGRTGSGKTLFLNRFAQAVDLEGLANHRGSAFGSKATPQPSQASFENALIVRLLQQRNQHGAKLLFEDESRNIGSVHLPASLLALMSSAPIIVLETPDDERVALSYQAYIVDMLNDFKMLHQDETLGFKAFEQYLLSSLAKIQRRLGGVRAQHVKTLMDAALNEQQRSGDLSAHQAWIRYVLLAYYDPMYDYQLSHKQQRLIFKGTAAEITEFLSTT